MGRRWLWRSGSFVERRRPWRRIFVFFRSIDPNVVPTARKIELIEALSETGLHHIQIVSFVNPKRVPGMADAEDVCRGLPQRGRPSTSHL